MEEGVAASIERLHPPAQIIPALDRVNRLILYDPLQDVGRGRPGDALHHQKAAVEPGIEEVDEIILDAGQVQIVAAMLDQIFAHADKRSGAAWREVETPKQLLAGWLDCPEEG